jgi:hypothetical protein
MERCALDIMGPITTTRNGNRYILVIGDYFTKWTEAFPLPNIEAETVAKVFVKEFVCRFGVCRQLHSDQGSNFESKLFAEVCRLLEIHKTRTTPFHPQSDGMIERFNRTLGAMLASTVAQFGEDWDEILPFVMMAYRSSRHDSTGHLPNILMFGREVDIPLEIVAGRPLDDRLPMEASTFVTALQQKLETVYSMTREAAGETAQRQKRLYDMGAHGTPYKEGDAVWLYCPNRRRA